MWDYKSGRAITYDASDMSRVYMEYMFTARSMVQWPFGWPSVRLFGGGWFRVRWRLRFFEFSGPFPLHQNIDDRGHTALIRD